MPRDPSTLRPNGRYRVLGSTLAELLRTQKAIRNIIVRPGQKPYNQLIIDPSGSRAYLNVGTPAQFGGGGGGGSGLPEDASFEEFTICDSGSPATRWLATWTSDPS